MKGRSSTGRAADSESASPGSNPGAPAKLKEFYVEDALGGPRIPVARLASEREGGGIVLNLVQLDAEEIPRLIAWLKKAEKVAL